MVDLAPTHPGRSELLHPVVWDGGVTARRAGVRNPALYYSVTGNLPSKPPMPLLDPSDSPGRWAWLLAAWFEAVAQQRTGKVCWAIKSVLKKERKIHVAQTSLSSALSKLAKKSLDLGIPPSAWIHWTFDVWESLETFDPSKPTPPLRFTFSTSFLEKQESFFWRANAFGCVTESGSRRIPRESIPLNAEQRDFIDRQYRYAAILGALPVGADDATLRRVDAACWPGGFDACVAELLIGANLYYQDLLTQSLAGVWIWTY